MKVTETLVAVFMMVGVAQAGQYVYECFPNAQHMKETKIKFNDEQQKKIGAFRFILDTDKNVVLDKNDKYPYEITINTPNGDISIYKKDRVRVMIKDYEVGKEKYQAVGLVVKGVKGWTEFLCEVQEAE